METYLEGYWDASQRVPTDVARAMAMGSPDYIDGFWDGLVDCNYRDEMEQMNVLWGLYEELRKTGQ
jgi:hypothetical protein